MSNNISNKRYKSSNEEKSKIRKMIESKNFRKILSACGGITCVAAGVYGKDLRLIKSGAALITSTIDLSKQKIKYSDIKEQENILDKDMNRNLAIE